MASSTSSSSTSTMRSHNRPKKRKQRTILVTGGTGYIGSHCILFLLEAGYTVVMIDNYSNSSPMVIDEIFHMARGNIQERFFTYDLDLCNYSEVFEVFKNHPIDAVIHMAASKSVPESLKNPLKYYYNNLVSLLNLLDVMKKHRVERLIFSSSACVYPVPLGNNGTTTFKKVKEDSINFSSSEERGNNQGIGCSGIKHPYGQTKLWGEKILYDLVSSMASSSDLETDLNRDKWKKLNFIALRYGNPVNGYPSIMETVNYMPPHKITTDQNLYNIILEVIQGKRKELTIFGKDYDTLDGTAVRDFIHVFDVARAHVAALNVLFSKHQSHSPEAESTFSAYNVGTGRGYSVLEIVRAMEAEHEVDIPLKFGPAREGDAPHVVFDVAKARNELKWEAKFSEIEEIVKRPEPC